MESMAATLAAAARPGFSETARSRPGHGEAGRHGHAGGARAVLGGRLAHDRAERPAERPQAGEADVEADVGHAAVGLDEQEHRPLDAPALEVAVRRLAERRPERPDEVRLGDVGDPRERGYVERLRVAAVHRVAGAQQTAVGLEPGIHDLDRCSGSQRHPQVGFRHPSIRATTDSSLMEGRAPKMVIRVVLLACAAMAAAPAVAAAQGCPEQPTAPVFAPWGDAARYALAPDGGFEAGAAGWALSDGAAVTAGNEPFAVGGGADASALSLPAGAEATSPRVCIDVAHPTIRLFARDDGGLLSALRVSVRFRTLLGWKTVPVGVVAAGGDWRPTPPVPVVVNLLSLLGGAQDVALRFDADGGDWVVDDVYVDPYSKG